MREILFLAHRIPYPPNKGDKIRSWHFLEHLAKRHRVHLGCFVDDPFDLQYVDKLRAICGESYFAMLKPRVARLRGLVGLLQGAPLTVPYYRHAGLAQWVARMRRRPELDCVFVYCSSMAQYVMDGNGIRRVIDFVDVDSDKWQQYAEALVWPRSWLYRREGRTLLGYERDVAGAFDASLFVSPAEADHFRGLAPDTAHKIFHVSNGVDSEFFSPDTAHENLYGEAAHSLVFTGMMDYRPNIDAAEWFARAVLPELRKRVPGATFHVVGAAPTPEVKRLGSLPGVTVTGRVADVRPYIAHAALFVAPLRISRGIQNKVLEGMAMAKTVIATPQAFEGIEAEVGREILLAADVPAFVETIVDLIASDARAAIGRAARARVVADYAWSAKLARLDAILDGAAGAPCP